MKLNNKYLLMVPFTSKTTNKTHYNPYVITKIYYRKEENLLNFISITYFRRDMIYSLEKENNLYMSIKKMW